MTNCSECGTADAMYETAGGNQRCWKCGYTVEQSSRVRERPNRPEEAKCGDVLERVNGETRNPFRRLMNTDGSNCSKRPRGIQEQNGEYVVVCSRHRE